jgi:hypothetical protein
MIEDKLTVTVTYDEVSRSAANDGCAGSSGRFLTASHQGIE